MSETTDGPRRAYLTKARRSPLTGRRPRRRDLRVNRQLQPVTGVASSSPNPRTRAIGPWDSPGGPGVRVDTTVFAGYEIPPFYDSMVGKLIVYGTNRHEALMADVGHLRSTASKVSRPPYPCT